MMTAAPNLEELEIEIHTGQSVVGQLDLIQLLESINENCPKLNNISIKIDAVEFTRIDTAEELQIIHEDFVKVVCYLSWVPALTNLTKFVIDTDFKSFDILSKLRKLEEINIKMEGTFTRDEYTLPPKCICSHTGSWPFRRKSNI